MRIAMSSIRSPEGSRTNWTSPLPGVLPAEVRRRLDLQEGDRIMLSFDDEGSMRLCSARQAARRTRGWLRRIAPALRDRRLAEELIAERRAEAA
jgi:bifunctional DNA-binding transcriptional regulator/antitoxin component of YhaV-PrlF toxin-antitoxin module